MTAPNATQKVFEQIIKEKKYSVDLISYECETDAEFEFCRLMRLR